MKLDVGGKVNDGPRHTLRLSDRVYQRMNPDHRGTVTHVEPGVSFTVTYDREKGQRRSRFTYDASRQGDFLIGRPE